MAQGGIRKGFFFYFGLFVLLLIAIFLIILVVLLFNPGKTILWMQYFTGDGTHQITKTTDTETDIDFNNLTRIEIDCSMADVTIQRHENIKKDCIQIVNNAKGFATSAQARDFSYSVTQQGSVLTISVVEPVGFLYMSSEVSITVNIAWIEQNQVVTTSGDYSNIDFEISTTSGDVIIGSTSPGSHTVAPKSITAETTSGNIYVNSNSQIANTNNISFTTDNGLISANSNNVSINSTDKNAKGLVINSGNIKLRTNKGEINYDLVQTGSGTLTIENDRGSIVIGTISAQNTSINCYEGNYKIGTIKGNISFTASEDKIASPNVRISEIIGDFSMSSKNDASPDVIIDKLTGYANVNGISGYVEIKELSGFANIDMNDGSMVINFADQSNGATDTLTSQYADITVGMKGELNHNINITTTEGKVTFNVTNKATFISTAYQKDNESEKLGDDKIAVNIGYEGTKNPLNIQSSTSNAKSTIVIKTNGNVEYNLKDAIWHFNWQKRTFFKVLFYFIFGLIFILFFGVCLI